MLHQLKNGNWIDLAEVGVIRTTEADVTRHRDAKHKVVVDGKEIYEVCYFDLILDAIQYRDELALIVNEAKRIRIYHDSSAEPPHVRIQRLEVENSMLKKENSALREENLGLRNSISYSISTGKKVADVIASEKFLETPPSCFIGRTRPLSQEELALLRKNGWLEVNPIDTYSIAEPDSQLTEQVAGQYEERVLDTTLVSTPKDPFGTDQLAKMWKEVESTRLEEATSKIRDIPLDQVDKMSVTYQYGASMYEPKADQEQKPDEEEPKEESWRDRDPLFQ